ncbi:MULTISPECIES: TonB-dependent receptor [unclassified Brenneria]|uniref:TonB-dependent siderophore receptor n=1 Tax=unclassified Brenneria TaxID=2634434 RepID=UPI0029C23D64|nr:MULTISPECIES: TonB-dependent receptor [unclassified Brenneria]MDX5630846.1 TonB-dependent receptor [Brenneria sp. L3-3Z]MDX5697928.1 TonB-dependent receptor [Brenneria sp. L4-2C]
MAAEKMTISIKKNFKLNKLYLSFFAIYLVNTSALAQGELIVSAQPLGQAVAELARETNVNILVPTNLVEGKNAPALSGNLTVEQALARLLAGTGLTSQKINDKTYVIKSDPSAPVIPSKSADSTSLPTISVFGASESTGAEFIADSSDTATRSDLLLSETPQSVQVSTNDLIQSRQTQTVGEVLSQMAGVTTTQNGGNGSGSVYIRGVSASTMSNGLSDTGSSNSLLIPTVGVERVEVISGADSIISAGMNPGGTVNIVSKQPTARTVRELTLETGSHGHMLGAIDLGGALTDDQKLTSRLVISGDTADHSFGGYDGQRSKYFAPSLRWTSGGTDLTVGYQHLYVSQSPVPETLLGSSGPYPLVGRSSPSKNSTRISDTVRASLKQDLGDHFQYVSKAQYNKSSYEYNGFYSLQGGTPQSAQYLGLFDKNTYYGYNLDNYLLSKFQLGETKHTFTTGYTYQAYWSTSNGPDIGYYIRPFPASSLPGAQGASEYNSTSRAGFNNLYFQEQLEWGDFRLLAGWSKGTSWSHTLPRQSKWVPNYGLLYQVTDDTGVYVNTKRSYLVTGSKLLDGSMAPPQSGKSTEVGTKTNFLDGNLTLNTALYQLAIDNAAIPDYATGTVSLGGALKLRGAELSLTGKVYTGLNVALSYTYSQIASSPIMDRRSVPKHNGSLWFTYDLQTPQLAGWGYGAGIQARSDYVYGYPAVGLANPVPGQAQVDTSVYYKAKDWSVTLGIHNIFDKTLYQSWGSQTVSLQPGREFYLTTKINL